MSKCFAVCRRSGKRRVVRMKEAISGKPAVIIDIGGDWLKCALATGGRTGLCVSSLALRQVDTESSTAADDITEALDSADVRRHPAVGCLPRQMVNIRMLELPSTDPEEIDDMVDFQVGKQTPYSRHEIVFDYRILKCPREGYTRVMLAIVQRTVLRQQFALLEEAGLEPSHMCVSSDGIVNWLEHVGAAAGNGDATVVLDVDAESSELLVVSGGEPVFSRSIVMGAGQLLWNDAHRDKLAREVRNSMDVCRGEMPDITVGKLVLTGAAARDEGLSDKLGTELGIVTESIDSLDAARDLPASPDVRDEAYRNVSLTSLIGTALAPENIKFRLIPTSVELRRGLITKARLLTAFGILVIGALLLASSYAVARHLYLKERLARLGVLVEKTGRTAGEVSDMRDVVMVANARRETRFAVVNLLNAVHAAVPGDVDLASLVFDGDDESGEVLVIEGTAGTFKLVTTLVDALEKSPLLKGVVQKGSTTVDSRGRQQFKIACALEVAE